MTRETNKNFEKNAPSYLSCNFRPLFHFAAINKNVEESCYLPEKEKLSSK